MARPIKAESADFTTDEFYTIQSNGTDKRYVVSFQEKIKLQTFFAGFINQVPEEIQVRLVDLDEPDDPIQYAGESSKAELLNIMERHDEVIFHHGKFDFMLRNPETEEYVAFDEHGLLFIYTDQDYSEILSELEVEYRQDEALIYEYDHWHIGLPEGEEKLAALISDLNLEEF